MIHFIYHLIGKQLSFIDTWKIQVTPTGVDPITSAFLVQCSTNWAMKAPSWRQANLLGSCLKKLELDERNLTNRKCFSVVCTLIDNDIRHHSGQNVLRLVSPQQILMTNIIVDKSTDNNIQR